MTAVITARAAIIALPIPVAVSVVSALIQFRFFLVQFLFGRVWVCLICVAVVMTVAVAIAVVVRVAASNILR